jgi:hypothetical protein
MNSDAELQEIVAHIQKTPLHTAIIDDIKSGTCIDVDLNWAFEFVRACNFRFQGTM